MTTEFVVSLGTTGVVKSSISLRVYIDGVASASLASDATFTEIDATGDYLVSGLPSVAPGSWYTVTWGYPAGVGGGYRFPTQTGAPPNAVLPVRETGLSTADLNLKLYKNGVEDDATLVSSELGSPGDYLVSGWPTDETGSWVLRWRRGAVSFALGWTVVTSPTTRGILDDLADCFPDTLIAQPVSLNAFGEFSASGSPVSLKCYIEGANKLIRDLDGQEVVSSLQAYIGEVSSLTVDGHRYTLPGRFNPSADLRAISVQRVSDENGAHHEVVMFP